jgi:hypothetical protein
MVHPQVTCVIKISIAGWLRSALINYRMIIRQHDAHTVWACGVILDETKSKFEFVLAVHRTCAMPEASGRKNIRSPAYVSSTQETASTRRYPVNG